MNLGSKNKTFKFRGRYASGLISGLATAHTSTAGFFWIVNDPSSSLIVAVRKVLWASAVPAAQATPAARVTVERCSTTSSATGTTGTVTPLDSVDALPSSVKVVTASTGMTLTAGGIICSAFFGQAMDATPAGSVVSNPGNVIFDDNNDLNRAVLLRAGEAAVCRQADNGDTDQRGALHIDFEVYQLSNA